MEHAQDSTPFFRSRRFLGGAVVVGIALIVALGVTISGMLSPAVPVASTPGPTVSATPAASAEPTVAPPPPIPADTTVYDPSTLAPLDVFAVNPGLVLDDDPFGALTGESARPRAAGAPVFAGPSGQPIAFLPRDLTFDGTTMPVIQREENWVRVLLVGRQAYPSQGSSAQVTGWLRASDVEIVPSEATVEVNLTARTIDIVREGVAERIATDFGSGVAETPTPSGRTYIMTTRVEPSFGYTRGYPLVYLAVQSPTLDGFGGATVAVTAFHYHDERSGILSNGCLRVDPAAIEKLAALPLGTPVIIRP